jgi:hypothetical protein
MINRRDFLRTTASAFPLTVSLDTLHSDAALGENADSQTELGSATPKLVALPTRLAPLDPATLPWQQKVRRVGQSNMTEHDPAVMNIDGWANF